MAAIWKFPLAVTDSQRIEMPKGAEILAIQRQGAGACLWALVDSDRDKEGRVIEVHGTGNEIYQDVGIERKYIGTFQAEPFVWHVFERIS